MQWHSAPNPCPWPGVPGGSVLCNACYSGFRYHAAKTGATLPRQEWRTSRPICDTSGSMLAITDIPIAPRDAGLVRKWQEADKHRQQHARQPEHQRQLQQQSQQRQQVKRQRTDSHGRSKTAEAADNGTLSASLRSDKCENQPPAQDRHPSTGAVCLGNHDAGEDDKTTKGDVEERQQVEKSVVGAASTNTSSSSSSTDVSGSLTSPSTGDPTSSGITDYDSASSVDTCSYGQQRSNVGTSFSGIQSGVSSAETLGCPSGLVQCPSGTNINGHSGTGRTECQREDDFIGATLGVKIPDKRKILASKTLPGGARLGEVLRVSGRTSSPSKNLVVPAWPDKPGKVRPDTRNTSSKDFAVTFSSPSFTSRTVDADLGSISRADAESLETEIGDKGGDRNVCSKLPASVAASSSAPAIDFHAAQVEIRVRDMRTPLQRNPIRGMRRSLGEDLQLDRERYGLRKIANHTPSSTPYFLYNSTGLIRVDCIPGSSSMEDTSSMSTASTTRPPGCGAASPT